MIALKDYSLLTILLPETTFTVKPPYGGTDHGNPYLNMLTISLASSASSLRSSELPLLIAKKFT